MRRAPRTTYPNKSIPITMPPLHMSWSNAGAGSTSLHLKSRTQDALYMSLPNLLPQGGSEVLLFYVND